MLETIIFTFSHKTNIIKLFPYEATKSKQPKNEGERVLGRCVQKL